MYRFPMTELAAGTLPGFDSFSTALKSSGLTWDAQTLDQWPSDPERLVPDHEMPLEGVKDASAWADLLAFLKEATKSGTMPQRSAQHRPIGAHDGRLDAKSVRGCNQTGRTSELIETRSV